MAERYPPLSEWHATGAPAGARCSAEQVAVITGAHYDCDRQQEGQPLALQISQRWVNQYNSISTIATGVACSCGCVTAPFSARVCLNQQHWLAKREEGFDFQQPSNPFLKCGNPQLLQELADLLAAQDLIDCGQEWLTALTPFFREKERKEAGCQQRLFFAEVEYCDNLIFHRRAALDALGERLLDGNRTIGRPNKITVIFGRNITKQWSAYASATVGQIDLF